MIRYLARLRPVINSNKHEVTYSHLAQDSSTKQTIQLTLAVDMADKNTSTEVTIGSHVRWIFCEFQFSAETITVVKTIHWAIRWVPSGQVSSGPNQLFGTDRAFVIKRGMEMLPKDVNTVFKRVFTVKIPRKYQRQTDNGSFVFEYIASSTNTMNSCGIFIYKEIN